jgi:hypothetical protein
MMFLKNRLKIFYRVIKKILYLECFDALLQQHMDVALLPALGVGLLHPADVPVPGVQGVRPCQQQKQCSED